MGINIKQRSQMKDYVAHILETSEIYNFKYFNDKEYDNFAFAVTEKKEYFLNPKQILLFLINKKISYQEHKYNMLELNNKGVYTSNIIYRDGEEFFVRLAKRANFKSEKSLKKLSQEEINQTIHLRNLEKLIVERQKINYLTYYQPETKQIQESLRRYSLKNVKLDYSHITDERRNYVQNITSIDYMISKLDFEIHNGPIYFNANKINKVLTIDTIKN